jgi:hypothetical protein
VALIVLGITDYTAGPVHLHAGIEISVPLESLQFFDRDVLHRVVEKHALRASRVSIES